MSQQPQPWTHAKAVDPHDAVAVKDILVSLCDELISALSRIESLEDMVIAESDVMEAVTVEGRYPGAADFAGVLTEVNVIRQRRGKAPILLESDDAE